MQLLLVTANGYRYVPVFVYFNNAEVALRNVKLQIQAV